MSSPDHEAVKKHVVELLGHLRLMFGEAGNGFSTILAVENMALACYRMGLRTPIARPPKIPTEALGLVKSEPHARDSQRPTPRVSKRRFRG